MDLVLPPVGPGFDLVVEGITGAGGLLLLASWLLIHSQRLALVSFNQLVLLLLGCRHHFLFKNHKYLFFKC